MIGDIPGEIRRAAKKYKSLEEHEDPDGQVYIAKSIGLNADGSDRMVMLMHSTKDGSPSKILFQN